MKRALLAAALLFVAVIAVFLWKRGAVPPAPGDGAPSSVSPAASPAGGSPAASTAATAGSPQAPGARANPAAAAPAPGPDVSPKFVTFLADESRQLDSKNVDVSAAETRMKSVVASIGAGEVRYSREVAQSPTGPANQRIMGAYVVAQTLQTCGANKAAWAAAVEAASDLITRPSDSARAEPHSAAELFNMQQKSFALMNVDALAECAARDAGARDTLIRLGSQAKDASIAGYIRDKARSLPPL